MLAYLVYTFGSSMMISGNSESSLGNPAYMSLPWLPKNYKKSVSTQQQHHPILWHMEHHQSVADRYAALTWIDIR